MQHDNIMTAYVVDHTHSRSLYLAPSSHTLFLFMPSSGSEEWEWKRNLYTAAQNTWTYAFSIKVVPIERCVCWYWCVEYVDLQSVYNIYFLCVLFFMFVFVLWVFFILFVAPSLLAFHRRRRRRRTSHGEMINATIRTVQCSSLFYWLDPLSAAK